MVSSVLRIALARLSFVRDCCAIFSVHRQCLGFAAWLVFPPKKWGKLIRHQAMRIRDASMTPRRLQAVTRAIKLEHLYLYLQNSERASLNYFKSRVLDYPQPYPKDILQEITQQLHNQTSISGQPTSFFSVAWALPWFPSQSLLPAGASLGRRQDPPNPAGPSWRKAQETHTFGSTTHSFLMFPLDFSPNFEHLCTNSVIESSGQKHFQSCCITYVAPCILQLEWLEAPFKVKQGSNFQPADVSPWEVGPVLATCNGAFGMTSAALPLIFKLLRLGVFSVSSTGLFQTRRNYIEWHGNARIFFKLHNEIMRQIYIDRQTARLCDRQTDRQRQTLFHFHSIH